MSTRFPLQDALLIALVLLAPAFTAGRLADALAGAGPPATEAAVLHAGVPVDEVAPLVEPVAADVAATTTVIAATAVPA